MRAWKANKIAWGYMKSYKNIPCYSKIKNTEDIYFHMKGYFSNCWVPLYRGFIWKSLLHTYSIEKQMMKTASELSVR